MSSMFRYELDTWRIGITLFFVCITNTTVYNEDSNSLKMNNPVPQGLDIIALPCTITLIAFYSNISLT